MTTTQAEPQPRTLEQILDMVCIDRLSLRNWEPEGPWAFDDTVLLIASCVRWTELSEAEEHVVFGHVARDDVYAKTLQALADRGKRDFITAALIVAMWRQLEA